MQSNIDGDLAIMLQQYSQLSFNDPVGAFSDNHTLGVIPQFHIMTVLPATSISVDKACFGHSR